MTERLKTICSRLPASKTFADVGCDHGYCAKYALDNALCERAYISDISRESLKKAETLLENDIASGRCVPVCTDGLTGFPELPDCVLIAGMGGEEIIKILSQTDMPRLFVLQPMKNADRLRSFLLGRGCRITADFTFEDGKFYDLITGEGTGSDRYSPWEIEFGRDNLLSPSPAFARKIALERKKAKALMLGSSLSPKSRERVTERFLKLEAINDALEENI